jgi:hypothetical protein
MSNASKTGQQEEGHADPSESNLSGNLSGNMNEEDTREGVERTSRVGKGT